MIQGQGECPMSNPNNPFSPASFAGMADADYRNAKGLSKSMLTHFAKSPAHYIHALTEKVEPTKAMVFGTAFHAEMLMPIPSEHYAVKLKMDGRTKEGKAYNEQFEIQNAGKACIDVVEEESIKGMRQAVWNHPLARQLMEDRGLNEFSVFATFTEGRTPVLLKGRFDAFNIDTGVIIDLKSCEDASPEGFRKACRLYRYDLQYVQYTWLASQLYTVKEFYFIAVEKSPPYAVGVYKIGDQTKKYANLEWNRHIQNYAFCEDTQTYPAYSDECIALEL